MKKLSIPGALSAGLLMLISSLTQAAAVSGQGTWETTLQGRDLDGNLATAEAYYDTVLGITWLADANYAGALMDWWAANTWAAGLNPYSSGITGWRLPTTSPVDGVSYNHYFSDDGSTDFGYNISALGSAYPGSTGSEMAHLFYNTLGNLAHHDTSGNPQSGYGLSNTGLFVNVHSFVYWSATEALPSTNFVWNFIMVGGFQDFGHKAGGFGAWAVHDGDVGASTVLPVPAAVWLFGSGLLGLGAAARKRRR